MTPSSSRTGVILLGPTGAGKTPLGESLSAWGHGRWRFHHFDFGHWLRIVISDQESQCLFDDDERHLVADILASGRLLKDEEFFIADRLLRSFLSAIPYNSDRMEVIILNGLPRTLFQAERIIRLLPIQLVVNLQCTLDVVFERIHSNVGGDRTGRDDDLESLVAKKYCLYESETRPLVDYYRGLGIPVVSLAVTTTTTAEELRDQFLDRWSKLFEGTRSKTSMC
ncbi:MAG TPA: nucleoside monophosphate kinase [Thermogutta sp.]|nr:nucleoside monophosphate kinase [Thermogutta sp.]